MRRTSLVGLSAMLLTAAAPLAAQQAGSPEGQLHVVGQGDTLWDLAARYLSDPYRWPEIFSRNREVISDPDWIYPQQRIYIPGLAPDATAVALLPGRSDQPARTVFFAGESVQASSAVTIVRGMQRDELPVVQSGAFYAAGLLVPDSLMAPIGRVEEIVSPTVLPRQADPQIQPYDKVLLSVTGPVAVGSRLHLMRPGRLVPLHGRIYQSTGIARVLSLEAGTATVEIERMYHEVVPGDLALAMPVFEVRSGLVPQPASGIEGELLAFDLDQPLVSREDLAYISLGRDAGMAEGDELVAYLPATTAVWGLRPAVDVARVQVVRVGPSTSAVRVISMEQPALEAGLPVRLVAKMP